MTEQSNVTPMREPLDEVFDHNGTPLRAGDTVVFLDSAKEELVGFKAIITENQEIPLGNRLKHMFQPMVRCRLVDTGEEGCILQADIEKVEDTH